MAATNFLQLLINSRKSSLVGVEDWADRLSHLYTTTILIICCVIVTSKTYLLEPIACHMPTQPDKARFKAYVESACWVLGTLPIGRNQSLPEGRAEWKALLEARGLNCQRRWVFRAGAPEPQEPQVDQLGALWGHLVHLLPKNALDAVSEDKTVKISSTNSSTEPDSNHRPLPFTLHPIPDYYQWVPFILGIQCVMFYLPRVVWRSLTHNRLGTDINLLISKAREAVLADSSQDQHDRMQQVACSLQSLLFTHRAYRPRSNLRRRLSHYIGPLQIGHRMGNWIASTYYAIKLLYLTNAVFQLWLIKRFLHYDGSAFGFGLYLAGQLVRGVEWTQSLYFPRLAYCTLPLTHLGARTNLYAGTCALPINLFNERMYIFVWFWILFVVLATLLNLAIWTTRLSLADGHNENMLHLLRLRRYMFGLELANEVGDRPPERPTARDRPVLAEGLEGWNGKDCLSPRDVRLFVADFLRLDGVFLVNMFSINVGDLFGAELAGLLWWTWRRQYAGRMSFSHSSLGNQVLLRPVQAKADVTQENDNEVHPRVPPEEDLEAGHK